jgi:hypothetical protein
MEKYKGVTGYLKNTVNQKDNRERVCSAIPSPTGRRGTQSLHLK